MTVEESVTDWVCEGCGRRFEIRVVFFERAEPVDQVAFRDEVNRLLGEQGLTRTELARLVGVTPAYISVLLNGRRELSAAGAARVLRVLRAATDQ
jgi:predicted transcriptional regulator